MVYLRFFILAAALLVGCGSSSDNRVDFSTGTDGGDSGGASGAAGTSGAPTGGGAGGGGTGGDGAGGSSPDATTSCNDVTCTPPATCEMNGTARCVCPEGYDDPNGDGSLCDDIDECAEGLDDCDANATCENTEGGFDCTCNAPAYTGDGTTCGCASGYAEAGGQCLKEDTSSCTENTECASGNCVGGACCAVACDSPALCETLTGTVCLNGTTCQYGKLADDTPCDDGDACTTTVCFDGACVVESGVNCSDGDQCTVDTCDPATGNCSNDPIDVAVACDDTNPCTNDFCDPAQGCQHSDNDAAACTDNDPCTDDACSLGVCVSTAVDCSGVDDDCNVGVCVAGSCQAEPANQNGACTDGLGPCDATGMCDGVGSCVGDAGACGSLAASCSPCTTGVDCFAGRLCTCQTAQPGDPPIILVDGVCVPDTDECNADPCDPIAVGCVDPTPGGAVNGDVQCFCPAGYTGDGIAASEGCIDIDECSGANPCGPGVAPGGCNGLSPPGSYSCTCAAGYVSTPTATGPVCSCDLSGTYALVATSNLSWDPIFAGSAQVIEGSPPGGVDTYSWALRYQTIETDGTLTVETVPCGGTTPDLCDTALEFAHAQYQPNQVWGKSKINSGFPLVSASLVGAVPGGTYTEPEIVSLMGIVLDDPAGEWPPCRQCVGVDVDSTCTCPNTGTHTVTNKATWFDADEDGHLGVTTVDVSRGGELINGSYPDPPHDYREPSECPRILTPNGTYTYAEWPGLDTNGDGFRAYQWYGAARVISSLMGDSITFDSATNQCLISGTLAGPDAGKVQSDGRIQGCETCVDLSPFACNPDDACDDPETDSYDQVDQTQQLNSVTFSLEPMASIDLGPVLAMADSAEKESLLNQACSEVRIAFCPPGRNCALPQP